MYVAGLLADHGWNIYFPRRDKGFDFIVTKEVEGGIIVRPVQVKGKYPEHDRAERNVYGYIGRLTQLHEEMVLAIPFFATAQTTSAPDHVAFVPKAEIRPHQRGYRVQPAQFKEGKASPRRDYQCYFGTEGIRAMEDIEWKGGRTRRCS
jgi:hypothetical protein